MGLPILKFHLSHFDIAIVCLPVHGGVVRDVEAHEGHLCTPKQ